MTLVIKQASVYRAVFSFKEKRRTRRTRTEFLEIWLVLRTLGERACHEHVHLMACFDFNLICRANRILYREPHTPTKLRFNRRGQTFFKFWYSSVIEKLLTPQTTGKSVLQLAKVPTSSLLSCIEVKLLQVKLNILEEFCVAICTSCTPGVQKCA